MNQQSMGQIIRRLRKERGLTQEEMAEQLNISSAAVSKWESGVGMPDISQIVPLANLFGVPTDVLFGVYGTGYEEEVKARLEEIFRMSDNCPDGQEGPTALAILDKYREIMRRYPNHPTVLTNAIAFAQMALSQNGDDLKALIGDAGVSNLEGEIARWAELVIKYSADEDAVLFAKRALIDLCVRRQNWDRAYELADGFPKEIFDLRGIRMADLRYRAGQTEAERAQRCQNIRDLAAQLGVEAAALGNLYLRQGKYADALYCYRFLGDTVEAIYREEEYRPPFCYDDFPLYRFPAYCLMKLGREQEAADILAKGVDFILAQDRHFNQKGTPDTPLLADCVFRYGYDGDARYGDLSRRLNRLVSPEDFAPLSGNPTYQSLLARIQSLNQPRTGGSETEG